jgi:tetratricopeptide (TPR) repeat protein
LNNSRFDEAISLIQPVIDVRGRLKGLDHNDTLEAIHCLVEAQLARGNNAEAFRLAEDLVQRARRSPSVKPETLLGALHAFAWLRFQLGDRERWLELNQEGLRSARERLGNDHPSTLQAMFGVESGLRLVSADFGEAERLAQEVYARSVRVLGEDHGLTLSILSEMALLAGAKGLEGEHLRMQTNLVELNHRVIGSQDPWASFEQMRLGDALRNRGYLPEAESLLTDALARIHHLQGPDTLLGRRVMRWLSGVYVGQGRYADAEELRRKVLAADERVLGKQAAETRYRRMELANLYARQGKWSLAADLSGDLPIDKAIAPAGSASHVYHCAGLLACALADGAPALRMPDLRRLTIERFCRSADPQVAQEVSRTLLLIPNAGQQSDQVLRLAELAITNQPDPAEASLLAGLAAYRRGDWPEAQQLLSRLTPSGAPVTPSDSPGFSAHAPVQPASTSNAGHPDGRIATVAGFFLAMAHHQQGHKHEAAEYLVSATNRLERILRSGDLGTTTTYPGEEWMPLAASILARNQGEELIHGRRVSAPVDAEYLAATRQRWKPVKEMIEQADWQARRRQWSQAKAQLLQAMKHERFDWEAAAHQFHNLADKAAALFVLTRDWDAYDQLCHRLVRVGEFGPSGVPGPLLLSADHPSPGLKHAALVLVRRTAETSDEKQSATRWHDLTLGMAEYRNGHLPEALLALNRAQSAYNLNCSGTARAFAAMAQWDSGRAEEARRLVKEAEDLFQQVRDGNQGDLGPWWHPVATFEISLAEAREHVR